MRRGIIVAIALGAAGPAQAFECTLGRTCLTSPRWADRVATYAIEPPPADAGMDEATLRRVVERAFASWTSRACTDLVSREDPSSPNKIRVVTRDWAHKTQVAGLTRVEFNGINGSISKATIDLNAEFFDFAVDRCEFGQVDLEHVVTHELGHYIGLAHPCEIDLDDVVHSPTGEVLPSCPTTACGAEPGAETESVLYPIVDSCVADQHRGLGPDDVEAICSIYPRTGGALPCVELPPQDSYIRSEAFGCQAVGGPTWVALALSAALIFAAGRRARV